MRRKAQSRTLTSAPNRGDTIKGGPPPSALYGDRRAVPVAQAVAAKSIAKQQASNQDKYGANREKIRQIIRSWGRS